MNEITPLTRPLQSQITIDSVAKDSPSEGFNYPKFSLLNKHARLYLSKPLQLESGLPYQLFDTANSKGWFVAVKSAGSGSELVFSTLEHLRSSISSTKDDPDALFIPKRTVSIPSRANIVKFACGDTRLLVGQDNGSILLYDTAHLFSEGSVEAHPLTSTHIQTTYLRHIVPNPGSEPGLSDLVAIVGDGKVQLVNGQLEAQGGWAATDDATQPVSVDWSPKGKHLAIGIQSGDIMTFSLTNRTTPHKHIPPTANGPLVSVQWLGPGHTFRTSYANAIQHIIVLEAKSSTAIYYAPDHPFPAGDRPTQNAYTINLPKWDTDASSSDDSKALTIVGDLSSVDIEVLGNSANAWFRQSQDNPVSLPLDTNMEDTYLLSLDVDLTDSASGQPVVYAYLNDGSIQAWHLESSKPYAGMITSEAASMTVEAGKDSDMGTESAAPAPSAFGQSTTTTNAFGQSSFSTQTSSFSSQTGSGFGQTGFGAKPATTSAFGQSSFGQPSAFGQSSQPASTSPFASATPASGGFAAFGSSGNNAFGSGGGGFGSGGFGSQTTGNAFGQTGFGSNTNTNTNTNAAPAQANNTASSDAMTREASMSDATPAISGGFGGLGLGGAHPTDPKATNSMFGSFGSSTTPATQTSSGFGGSLLKPATGFGAFGASKTSAFSNPQAPSTNAFGSTPTAFASAPASTTTPAPGSGFGQSGFGAAAATGANQAFGKPAFGQPAFGQSAFGKPSATPSTSTPTPTSTSASTTTAPASAGAGAFAAFANAPTNSLAAAAAQKPASTTTTTTTSSGGGFAGFASKPAGFGAASASTSDGKPASGFGAFGSSTTGAFGSSTAGAFGSAPAFGSSSTAAPAFGSTATAPALGSAEASSDSKAGGGFAAFSAAPATFGARPPEGTPQNSVLFSPQKDIPNVFSGIKTTPAPATPTPATPKPASGFGAFATPAKDSPFLKKPEDLAGKGVSAFGAAPATPSKAPAASVSTGLAFGAPSALGANKSAFGAAAAPAAATTPTKTPTAAAAGGGGGAFSAFSGAATGFASMAGKKSSFGELLKSGGDEIKEATAPALTDAGDAAAGKGKAAAKEGEKEKPKVEEYKPRTSFLATPLAPAKKDDAPVSVFPLINKGEIASGVKSERTQEWVTSTSGTSSFVEVDGQEGASDEEDLPHSDVDSFLSDDEEEEPEIEEEEEDGEEGQEEEEEQEEEEDEEEDLEEVQVPDNARSPSATPQPQTPAIQVSQDSNVTQTQPATPGRSGSPFGLGLGRPSTRPTRSSPLANAVGSDGEESEQDEGKGKKPAASPKPPVAVLPLKSEEEDKDGAAKRPKTPPLLSTLGGAATDAKPSIFGQAASSASIFGQPSSSSIFGKPATPATPSSAAKSPEAGSSVPNFFAKPSGTQGKDEPARPATAPPANVFGIPPPTFASSSFQLPSLPKAASSMPNVFSGIKSSAFPPPASGPSSAAPAPPVSVFGAAGGLASPGAQAAPSMFAPKQGSTQPTTPSPLGAKPTVTSPPSTLPPMTLFGKPGQASAATPSKAGPQQGPKPSPSGPSPGAPGTSSPARAEETENVMQVACRDVVLQVESDLLDLKNMMPQVAVKIKGLSLSRGGGSTVSALGKPEKWNLDDMAAFGETLQQFCVELDLLETQRESYEKEARDLQSSLVKAGMRKEEISRFMKAKSDKEFAKMLKSRALGPEHSEMQARLRKNIRMMRDRVQKLETRLVESKKKLAEANSCKPSLKPPTIDTINRTYRNIEIAIEQQADEVSRLASRISRLKVDESGAPLAPSTPVRAGSAPREGTPQPQAQAESTNMRPATAAALNQEVSANRLKNALLRVRKEPLLNTQALKAPPPPIAYDSPRKPSTSVFGATAFDSLSFDKPLELPTPTRLQGFGATLPGSSASPELNKMLDFSNLPPEDEFRPTEYTSDGPKRHNVNPRFHKSTATPKSKASVPATSPPPPAPPSTFNWGPLPNFNASTSPPIATPSKFVPFAASSPSPSAGPSAAPSNFFSSPSPPSKSAVPTPKGFVSFSSPSLGSK